MASAVVRWRYRPYRQIGDAVWRRHVRLRRAARVRIPTITVIYQSSSATGAARQDRRPFGEVCLDTLTCLYRYIPRKLTVNYTSMLAGVCSYCKLSADYSRIIVAL